MTLESFSTREHPNRPPPWTRIKLLFDACVAMISELENPVVQII